VHLDSLQQLFDTAYGRALIVKVVLVCALLVISAIHVLILRPRLARNVKRAALSNEVMDEAEKPEKDDLEAERMSQLDALAAKQLERKVAKQTHQMTSVLRWEPLVGVAVLVCTGLLNVFAGTLVPTNANPPAQPAPATKPFHAVAQTADKKFTVTIDVTPNRFGTNVFTVSAVGSNGAPDTNIGVYIYPDMLDMQMQSDAINLQPDGKGKFSGTGDLSMGGNWALRIQIRTPDDTLHEVTVQLYTPF
jgi:copper transport protein